MFEDGTWKQEIGEKDQIIALTTKLIEMQAKFDHQIASFVTQAKNDKVAPSTNSSTSANSTRRNKHDPYTVATWRLTKKEDTVVVNGREFYWCIGDHWSGGEKYNGMYTDHKPCDHDAWRKKIDDFHATRGSEKKPSSGTPASVSASTPAQKLTLNDKLRNAFCTQAGLLADEVDRIWQDAQGNE
jgi:hypothetical protein